MVLLRGYCRATVRTGNECTGKMLYNGVMYSNLCRIYEYNLKSELQKYNCDADLKNHDLFVKL